jgi:hypothetical protein
MKVFEIVSNEPTDVYELVNFFEAQNTAYEVDASGHSQEKKEGE